jgi:hypothetical protein
LFLIQLQNVLDDYALTSPKVGELDGETFEQRLKRVQDYLLKFPRAPFTLQRMAELLFEPKRYYNNTSKFFLAFSKLVCGISARNFDLDPVSGGSLFDDAENGLDGKKNPLLTGSIGFGLSPPLITPGLPSASSGDFFVETKAIAPPSNTSVESGSVKRQKLDIENKYEENHKSSDGSTEKDQTMAETNGAMSQGSDSSSVSTSSLTPMETST